MARVLKPSSKACSKKAVVRNGLIAIPLIFFLQLSFGQELTVLSERNFSHEKDGVILRHTDLAGSDLTISVGFSGQWGIPQKAVYYGLDGELNIVWEREIDTELSPESLTKIIRDGLGGFYAIGELDGEDWDSRDIQVLKMDSLGQILWFTVINNAHFDVPGDLCFTWDGRLCVFGEQGSSRKDWKPQMVFLDMNSGDILETKVIPASNQCRVGGIDTAGKDRYIAFYAERVSPSLESDLQFKLLVFDREFKQIQAYKKHLKEGGFFVGDMWSGLDQTVICGSTLDPSENKFEGGADVRGWLGWFDQDGNLLRERIFKEGVGLSFEDVIITTQGQVLVGGTITNSEGSRWHLKLLDMEGELIKSWTLPLPEGGSAHDLSITEARIGEYLITTSFTDTASKKVGKVLRIRIK